MAVVRKTVAVNSIFVHLIWCFLLTGCVCLDDDLQRELQTILDNKISSNGPVNLSFTLGVAMDNLTLSLSAGLRHDSNEVDDVTPADGFAMGSAAKMYTAAAVLRLVDDGKISLDGLALPLMDNLFSKLSGKSLAAVMGPQIGNVTVRQLLQMRSGIADFDNDQSRNYQFQHPQQDLGPVENIGFLSVGQAFECEPGECGSYSSTNYELLGLLLAQQAGASSWDTYDQRKGFPEALMRELNVTTFAVHGVCREYTPVHGFSQELGKPIDVSNISCTNGWTCGNLISNGADAAVFARALFGQDERVISSKLQNEMLTFQKLSQGWSKGLLYGLGAMDLSAFVTGEYSEGVFVGHAGDTYGFNGATGYSKKLDTGIALFANSEDMGVLYSTLYQVFSAIESYSAKNQGFVERRSLPVDEVPILV